ncbi:hypothetical protein HGRIS_009143 [Hohenbuehelia grisea]|uniref:Ferritin-like domain-containing protein n=1 Tax=Hohenbuehelia grisea TaxID=104357 RepID=A0ABR3J0P6_9AGAR
MRYSSSFLALAASTLVSAAPTRLTRRAAADVLVFQFADVLEQLESQFYSQALSKFQDSDFTGAGFTSSQVPIEQFKKIQQDEATHSTVLQSALASFGAKPVTTCKFDFSSVLTDVATMAATARVVENVGVSAYLGGATLLTDPVLLQAAGSILTVEARHQTILNVMNSGTAIPSAFDIPLAPNEILAIAGPFISGCDLGIPANPSLSITNTGTPAPGTLLTFKSDAINGTVPEDKLFCQMMIGGAGTSIPLPLSQCVVPEGINGPVAIWVTSDGQPLINNVRDRATSQLVAGPTYAFIDTEPQALGQLVKSSSGSVAPSNNAGTGGAPSVPSSASGSATTQTISPEAASSLIASASATATASDSASSATSTPAVAPEAAPAVSAVPSASAVSNAAGAPPAAGAGPNLATGPSADGAVTVNGWTNV